MNARKRIITALAAVSFLASGTVMGVNGTASEPVSDNGITPYIIPGLNPGGNRTCAEVGDAWFSDATYFQCWSAKRNYPDDFGLGFEDISGNPDCDRNVIEVTVVDGTYVTFDSYPDGVGAAIIKGSNEANVYFYDPQASHDSGLAPPLTPSGGPAGLSNIGGFCWNPEEEEGPPLGCWANETAWADGTRYTRRGNWALYTEYEYPVVEQTEELLAGQTMHAGTVTFSAPAGGMVTITIELGEGWRFAMIPVGEDPYGQPIWDNNVKVQDYASAPSGNPAPGGFMWKTFAEGDVGEIVVPVNNFYGVHVDVERLVDCPEE